MEKFLVKAYKFLKCNWNKAFALISLVGVVIFNFIPNAENYYKLFIFLGANAVVWTVIEIKSLVDEGNSKFSFPNMRDARSSILNSIRNEMQNCNGCLNIDIIGGRIRTISDMIREIKNDLETGKLKAQNTIIKIFTLDPSFFSNWEYTDISNNHIVINRFNNYAVMIEQLKIELLEYNDLPYFKNNGIEIRIIHYNSPPNFYGFLIGEKKLYWGFFTWDKNKNDFIGPENICFYLKKGDIDFDHFHYWLHNRLEFFEISKKEHENK
jgi:hypothetical protein